MRAALYARVSTEDQAERYGLAAQLTELRAAASARGYLVLPDAEYVDDGYSGAILERPALTRLRDACRAKAIDVVLIQDPDRLARSLVYHLLLSDEIERAGILLDYLTTPRTDTPEGKLLDHIKGVIAEYERAKIRERTKRGRYEKARQGLWVGGIPPYGYRRRADDPNRLEPHGDEAAVVRMVYSWFVTGAPRSIRSIALELNALGLRPMRGPSWSPTTVRTLLTHPIYTGRAVYGRRSATGPRGHARITFRNPAEWISIPVPAIVSASAFSRAQVQLVENKQRLTGRPPARVYLLAGMIHCARCGRRWMGHPARTTWVYQCRRDRRLGEWCGARQIPGPSLEARVWEGVLSVLRDPGALMARLERARGPLGLQEADVTAEATTVRRALVEVERRINGLLDLVLDPALPQATLRARLAALRQDQVALEIRLRAVQARVKAADTSGPELGTIERACRDILAGSTVAAPEHRRAILCRLLRRAVMYDREIVLHGVLPLEVDESTRTLDHFPAVDLEAGAFTVTLTR